MYVGRSSCNTDCVKDNPLRQFLSPHFTQNYTHPPVIACHISRRRHSYVFHPLQVISTAQKEFASYNGCGVSVMGKIYMDDQMP